MWFFIFLLSLLLRKLGFQSWLIFTIILFKKLHWDCWQTESQFKYNQKYGKKYMFLTNTPYLRKYSLGRRTLPFRPDKLLIKKHVLRGPINISSVCRRLWEHDLCGLLYPTSTGHFNLRNCGGFFVNEVFILSPLANYLDTLKVILFRLFYCRILLFR